MSGPSHVVAHPFSEHVTGATRAPGAVLLALAAMLGIAAVLVRVRAATGPAARDRPRPRRLRWASWLATVAGTGLAFQLFHVAEHVLQLGYWVAHPQEAPWLTPWAAVGRDVLAAADGQAGTGSELLHLLGNGIFLAGLLAALALPGRPAAATRALRLAAFVQGAHVGEHVLLTASWLAAGEATGVSTLFGLLEPGMPAAVAVRVWAHFLLNLVPTVLAWIGLRRWSAGSRPALAIARQ